MTEKAGVHPAFLLHENNFTDLFQIGIFKEGCVKARC